MKNKPFYKSKTFWGLSLALVAYYLHQEEIALAFLALAGYGFRDALK